MTEFEIKHLRTQTTRLSLEEVKFKYEFKIVDRVESIEDIGLLVARWEDDDRFSSLTHACINKYGDIIEVDGSDNWYQLAMVNDPVNFKNEYNNSLEDSIIDKFIPLFEEINPILEAVYPGQYDIQYNSENKKLNVLIKFDHIKITNSRDESRDIENLYTVLEFKINQNNRPVVSSFQGFRSTLSIKDYKNGYAHSHLNRRNRATLFSTGPFCTGSTPFSVIIADLSQNFDSEKFELFLYDLDNYVRWESLEGTPYIRLADDASHNIAAREVITVTDNQMASSLGKYFNLSTYVPNYSISYLNNNVEINILESTEFMQEVGRYADVKGNLNSQGYLMPLTEVNLEQVKEDEHESMFNVQFITFRNEEINYEIKKEGAGQESEFPHPEIFSRIKDTISKGIREEVLSKQFQTVSFPEHLKQDLVLV